VSRNEEGLGRRREEKGGTAAGPRRFEGVKIKATIWKGRRKEKIFRKLINYFLDRRNSVHGDFEENRSRE
jgi:hypothetical protein